MNYFYANCFQILLYNKIYNIIFDKIQLENKNIQLKNKDNS